MALKRGCPDRGFCLFGRCHCLRDGSSVARMAEAEVAQAEEELDEVLAACEESGGVVFGDGVRRRRLDTDDDGDVIDTVGEVAAAARVRSSRYHCVHFVDDWQGETAYDAARASDAWKRTVTVKDITKEGADGRSPEEQESAFLAGCRDSGKHGVCRHGQCFCVAARPPPSPGFPNVGYVGRPIDKATPLSREEFCAAADRCTAGGDCDDFKSLRLPSCIPCTNSDGSPMSPGQCAAAELSGGGALRRAGWECKGGRGLGVQCLCQCG